MWSPPPEPESALDRIVASANFFIKRRTFAFFELVLAFLAGISCALVIYKFGHVIRAPISLAMLIYENGQTIYVSVTRILSIVSQVLGFLLSTGVVIWIFGICWTEYGPSRAPPTWNF